MEWISGFKIFFSNLKNNSLRGLPRYSQSSTVTPEIAGADPQFSCLKNMSLKCMMSLHTEKPWGKPGFSPSSAPASCVTDSQQGAPSFWVPQKHGRITVSHSEVSASTGWTNACQTFSHVVYAKTFSELMSPRSLWNSSFLCSLCMCMCGRVCMCVCLSVCLCVQARSQWQASFSTVLHIGLVIIGLETHHLLALDSKI